MEIPPLSKMIAFCILMENNQGILEKAPNYIKKKWNLVMALDDPTAALDKQNQAKYVRYMRYWT